MTSRLQQRSIASVWHPATQMQELAEHPPLEVVSADGCWLRLADGSRVLDAISSWWCKPLGHRHPAVMDAIRSQLDAFDHVIMADVAHAPAVRLAERLLALTRIGDGRVMYAESGSVGVEIALKMALQWQAQAGDPRRTAFAGLAGAYHGETVGAMAVSDTPRYTAHYRPLLFSAVRIGPLPWRSGPDDPAWDDASDAWPACRDALEAAGPLAAVIVEPVLVGASGLRFCSPDLLRRLRAWCDAHGVLLIADEIAAGCHRLGPFLACHLAGVVPDIAVVGKGLTAGASPLAAVVASRRVCDAFEGTPASGRAFLHSTTFSGHALGCAAANATLDVFAAIDAEALVARRAPAVREALASVRHPRLDAVRWCGMAAAVDLLGCDPQARTGRAVYRAAVRRGALLRPLGDTLYLMPPYTISDEELAFAAEALRGAIAEVL